MTSIVFPPPYSKDELQRLYPKDLELRQVQVLLRHGERTPVSARFQNTGLAPYWPYCNAVRRLTSVVMSSRDHSNWDSVRWQRKLEHFGSDDRPETSAGPHGQVDGVCFLGELTDKGRETTLALGRRLRNLYINQLDFMPDQISPSDNIYLRTSPIPRALESLQQAFWGMYPPITWTNGFSTPTIVTREHSDETIFPNGRDCRRLRELSRVFSQRAANKWNDSNEIEYLNRLLSAWMPHASPRVAIDSHPRLTGILDTVNATLAHGPDTRLPPQFYDTKARQIMEKIAIDEWYTGYTASHEFRTLGIGALMGDIVERMSARIRPGKTSARDAHGDNAVQIDPSTVHEGAKESLVKFAMSGCHDSTLAAILTSLGAFEGESWPPFTSHLAIELFQQKQSKSHDVIEPNQNEPQPQILSTRPGWFRSLFGTSPTGTDKNTDESTNTTTDPSYQVLNDPTSLATTSVTNEAPSTSTPSTPHSPTQATHYVRIRYNDKPITIPACATHAANHLPSDKSFCTMAAFKAIVDDFTPRNWKRQCEENLGVEV